MDLVPLLKSLSEAVGVSGYESAVREVVRQAFADCADEVRVDAMGNLIACRRGQGEGAGRGRIMLAGHMDEIGLMVTMVEKGFLRFTQVGGFDVRTLPGQLVSVHARRCLPGIVGCRPPHVLPADARGKPTPMEELFIDVGLPPDEVQHLVRPGDTISLRCSCLELKNGRLAGKAFDDRAAVAAMAVCLDMLRGLRHRWDVYAVATVQEEVGLRGAMTSTFGVMPDVGIAIDVGFAKQPGCDGPEAIELDKGPALAVGPNVHPALFRELKAVAEAHEIPVQVTACPGGTGTDANAMQITREGVPTALISLPERSMHTPVETIAVRDIQRTGRLLALFIAGLDADFMAKLTWSRADSKGGNG
ncbi:MAG: M42 family metallopeptidase [Lentisphaeria bacterium]|nr:M42 family metallopeptidase [Lentisphaeria bacterium]